MFKLPAGTAKLAAVAEIGRQGFSIKPDQAVENGEFYNTSSSGEYSGTVHAKHLVQNYSYL